MHYRGGGWRAPLRDRCRELRRVATPAERRLWELLRDRRLDGWKFRRQHPFGPFILDFYCAACRLAVEVDGEVHWSAAAIIRDEIRSDMLEQEGIEVVRFFNDEVLRHTEAVVARLRKAIAAQCERVPRSIDVDIIDESFWEPSPFKETDAAFGQGGIKQSGAPSPR